MRKTLLWLAFVFMTPLAHAAVSIDNANVSTYAPSAANTTFSTSVTVGGSDNMLVMLCSAWNQNPIFAVAPTYNGSAMTKYFAQNGVGFSSDQNQEIWYIASPTVGTETVTATTSNNTNNGTFVCTFVPLNGVSSAMPFGTAVNFANATASAGSVTASGAGSGGVYLGQGYVLYTSIATGGAPMVNLYTGAGVDFASTSSDYIPGSSTGTFSYTGSGGSNAGVLVDALPVLAGATTASYPLISNGSVLLSNAMALFSQFATGTLESVKWHPGYYALSNSPTIGAGTSFTNYQTELNVINGQTPTVVGYTVYLTWAGLESSTQDNWQFQGCSTLTSTSRSGCGTTYTIDQVINQAWSQGQRVQLVINPNTYNGSSPCTPNPGDNGPLPTYITNNTGTYGASLLGSGCSSTGSSGAWTQSGGAVSANLNNAAVRAAFENAVNQVCVVYDPDPAVESIIFTALDVNYPASGTGVSDANYYADWTAVVNAAKASCPHTNVGIQVAFDSGAGRMEAFTTSLVQNKMVVSASDTPGATEWTSIFNLPGCTSLGGYWSAAPNGTSGTLAAGNTWEAVCSSSTVAQPYQLVLGNTTVSAVFTSGSNAVTWTPSVSSVVNMTSAGAGKFNWNPLNLAQGVAAWIGYSPVGSGYTPPGTSLFSLNSGFMLVEGGDFCSTAGFQPLPGATTFADIVSAANTYLQESHLSVAILQNTGQCSAGGQALWGGAGGVYATMQANPLTYTTYPSIY